MRYTTRTEYGLVCMIHLAREYGKKWVTIKEMADQEKYPVPYLEKILQSLRQSHLVISHHGIQGGYGLAKAPSEITLKHVIDAIEGSTFEVFCDPDVREEIVCNHICICGIKPIWKKTKEVLDHLFNSITLETIVKGQIEVQNLMASVKS